MNNENKIQSEKDTYVFSNMFSVCRFLFSYSQHEWECNLNLTLIFRCSSYVQLFSDPYSDCSG
jgi:hypothetical protein